MEGAAPAAPAGGAAPNSAAPESNAPAVGPGTQAGSGGQSPAPASPSEKGRSPTTPAKPRANDGRFLPKEGNVGVAPPEPPEEGSDAAKEAAKEEARKEAFRLKRKVKVYGEEQELDLDEDGAVREIARGRAALKKLAEATKFGEAGREVLKLAKENPEALFRSLGVDVEDWAKKRLATQAELAAMSPEERRAAEAEAQRDAYRAQLEQIAQAHQQQKREAELEQLRSAAIERYSAALKAGGLPKTYTTLRLMNQLEKEAMEDGIEYSPQELVADARQRIAEMSNQHLAGLDGPGLVEALGPERVKLILAASISQFEKAAGKIPGVQPPASRPPPPPEPEPAFIDEQELKRRMREIRNGKL
jgi:hypothetical protein